MEKLDQKYQIELDTLKGVIQSSDLLAAYLEEEDEASYQAMRDEFEPQIEALYDRVAEQHPLQLTTLEKELLHPDFEGMYIARILGFSVLRGEIDSENYHYKWPQDHFKQVLLAIAESANFEWISKKIGQGCQVGFALSSEVWVGNLINSVDNKRVRQFFESMHLDKYRDLTARKAAYQNYFRQFTHYNYLSANFPSTLGELKSHFSSLERFIQYRIRHNKNNASLLPNFTSFLNTEAFMNEREYLRILILFARYFPHEEQEAWIKGLFNQARTRVPDFSDLYFEYLLELEESDLPLDKDSDVRIHKLLDTTIHDDILAYSNLVQTIHQKGYIHEDAIEAVRMFYEAHEGLSDINECVRRAIYRHFERLISNLPEEDYKVLTGQDHKRTEEEAEQDDSIARYMKLYMDIFSNQGFTIRLRDLSMGFVNRCLKKFTDKRAANYQDVKNFVMAKFPEWGFMKEKEVIELFKTRRKRKAKSE